MKISYPNLITLCISINNEETNDMMPYIYLILPSYMVMAVLGIIVSMLYLEHRREKYNVSFYSLFILEFTSIAGVVIGSKLVFFVTQIPTLKEYSIPIMVSRFLTGGYVFYGGLYGMICALLLSAPIVKIKRSTLMQFVTPVIPLFHCFGRVGCFLSGCCHGVILKRPVTIGGVTFITFPLQLIGAVLELALFFVLLHVDKKEKTKHPLLFYYLLLYSIGRFVYEFFRGDTVRGIWFFLSTSQWICVFTWIGLGIYLWKYRGRSRHVLQEEVV